MATNGKLALLMRGRWLVGLISAVLALGCGDGDERDDGSDGAHAIYVLPTSFEELAEESFFDHPWPSDLRKEADGTIRFAGYPNPRITPIIEVYIDSMAGVLDGFSPVAPGYVRFDTAIDPTTLPESPMASSEPTSSVQLIDVDPASPEHGTRKRIAVQYRKEAGVYYQPNTLAFMPALGLPLRPKTRYALVVTDAIRTQAGGRVSRSGDLSRVLGLSSASGPSLEAKTALAPDLAELEAAGISKSEIVQLAVFTTDAPAEETEKLRDWVRDNYDAPTVAAASWIAKDQIQNVIDVYEGSYGPSPDFQEGTIPFKSYGDGGKLAFDASGTPLVQRDFDLRFALAVPSSASCPMPANGYPIVLYAHGTGGNYRSMMGSGDEAESLGKRCIATMGIDQIFHGTRPGAEAGTPELLFFNVQNPVAARANGPQSAIDVVQQGRLFTDSQMTVPASVSRTGEEIRFDGSRLAFVGHSQGGLNGPMFLAIDDQARGGMLSGSGSMIEIALLEKTEPVDVAGLVKSVFLGLSTSEYEELDLFHPALSLAQTMVDPTDPLNYVRRIATEPRDGFAAKSIMMTEGVNADGSGDSYAPPHGIEVQAVAVGLPPQNPVIHPIAELAWSDLSPITIPPEGLSGNLAGGKASGVLAQWTASEASDGHFVLYDVPGAMDQAAGFVENLMNDPVGRVPAP
jgi:hypothetical protein